MRTLARWLSMLLRNLGVGSEQRCSHSRACVGGWVWVCSKVVPPIQRPLAGWCRVRRQQCGKHLSSPAEINCAPVLSMFALWLWRSSQSPRGVAGALGLRVWREKKSGIRSISNLTSGMFCVLGESHADGVSVGLRIWAAAGALHPHLHAIAQEQHWGRQWSSNHSITAAIAETLERGSGITPKYGD